LGRGAPFGLVAGVFGCVVCGALAVLTADDAVAGKAFCRGLVTPELGVVSGTRLRFEGCVDRLAALDRGLLDWVPAWNFLSPLPGIVLLFGILICRDAGSCFLAGFGDGAGILARNTPLLSAVDVSLPVRVSNDRTEIILAIISRR
jgi:hypothetical protein